MPGAYPVRLLKTLGYEVSARAVCDLGYKKLGDLNFGTDHKLADTFRDSVTLPNELAFPEREMIIVEELKKQVRQSRPGAHLHFIAFDSPHYNYYWPERDFEPIHAGCDGTIKYTNINPSEEEIDDVRKRYHNAVNWMDRQIEDFVNFLKHEGRYDDATIIITGDHGEEFQEHGSWFHCSTLKREQTDVPIMIKWPSWMETPIPQRQVSHLDIMPSVLDMLGLDDKYLANLSGNSVLREHPGETVISTIHRGMSNVGVCLIKDGTKAELHLPRPVGGRRARRAFARRLHRPAGPADLLPRGARRAQPRGLLARALPGDHPRDSSNRSGSPSQSPIPTPSPRTSASPIMK